LASRIGALSLTLSIHLFTSRRAESSSRSICTTKATSPLHGKPIKDRLGFDQFQKSSDANGVDDTSVNESPCLTVFETSGAPVQKEIKARTVEDSTFLE